MIYRSFAAAAVLGLLGAACSDDPSAEATGDAGAGGSETGGGSSAGGSSAGGSSAGGSSAGGSSAGGSSAGGSSAGGGTATGGTAGTGGASGCSAPEPTVVLADVLADHLTLAGDGVVFVDRSAANPFPTGENGGRIRRIGADGTGDRTLYTAPADHLILSIAVFGDDVFFLEDTYAGVGQPGDVALHRVPHTSGSATLVGSLARAKAPVTELIAAEADQVFVNFGEDGIFRVALPGGAVEAVTTERILRNTALVGDDLFFVASQSVGVNALERLPKTATNRVGTVVLSDECKDGLEGSAGIFCRITTLGVASILRYDLDGTNRTILSELEPIGDLPGHAVALDTAHVYVAANDLPTLDGHPIWRIPVGGGTRTAVACDRHEFRLDHPVPSPTNNLLLDQFVVGAADLFWIERRTDGGPMSIFKNPK